MELNDYHKVVCDTETESLNLHGARPWQIAMVSDRSQYYKNIDIKNLKVSEDAARITRFNLEGHKKIARPVEEVCKKVYPIVTNPSYLFIGHNFLGFDIFMLRNLFREVGLKLDMQEFSLRCIDTLALSRGYLFESKPPSFNDREAFLLWQYKMLSKFEKRMPTSLSKMSEMFGIPVDDTKTHDGLYDSQINRKVYDKLEYALEF